MPGVCSRYLLAALFLACSCTWPQPFDCTVIQRSSDTGVASSNANLTSRRCSRNQKKDGEKLRWSSCFSDTLKLTAKAPENWLEDEFPFWDSVYFQRQCFFSGSAGWFLKICTNFGEDSSCLLQPPNMYSST